MADDPMIVSLRKPQKSGAAPSRAHDPAMVVSLKTPERAPAPEHTLRMTRPSHSPDNAGIQSVRIPASAASSVAREPRASAMPAPRRKRRRTPRFVYLLAGAVFVAIAVGSYFTFYTESIAAADPAQASALETNQLVARVGALMVLPQGETPTVATVSDLNALKGQAFFANAQVGDKVLMYPKAGQAILYDPVANKIVQSGPLTVDPQ